MDYNSMLANMMHVNPDESLMNEGRFLRTDACVIDKDLDKKSIQRPFLITALKTYEPPHEISNNVICATSKASDQPAGTSSLIWTFASRLNIL